MILQVNCILYQINAAFVSIKYLNILPTPNFNTSFKMQRI